MNIKLFVKVLYIASYIVAAVKRSHKLRRRQQIQILAGEHFYIRKDLIVNRSCIYSNVHQYVQSYRHFICFTCRNPASLIVPN